MERTFDELLVDANNLLEVQGKKGTWDQDEYLRGMYNGMELIVSVFEQREPIYKEAPEKESDNA